MSVATVNRYGTAYLHGEPTRLEASNLDRFVQPNLANEGEPIGAIALG